MKIEIILFNKEGEPALEIQGCHEAGFVQLKVLDKVISKDSTLVNIEELRTALRKIKA